MENIFLKIVTENNLSFLFTVSGQTKFDVDFSNG